MGTNFYLNVPELDRWNSETHIGKRSAAGLYCWDCEITLCKDGESRIHYGQCKNPEHKRLISCDCNWYKKCPNCGKKQEKESLDESTMGRELGFNKSEPKKKIGVMSCCSFNWGIPKSKLLIFCKQWKKKNSKPIIDEYSTEYTLKEFQRVLLECPIQYTQFTGTAFS